MKLLTVPSIILATMTAITCHAQNTTRINNVSVNSIRILNGSCMAVEVDGF
ncbi:hypothetical protein TWF694_004427 [Orbilia ellipsospora]|uniref:Uncharacterized protein n=1 Tax=Orbilia ellipsospora TaxID=2528407 RepID=A0AAV9WWC7_9PEZI